jgi:serine protease Do
MRFPDENTLSIIAHEVNSPAALKSVGFFEQHGLLVLQTMKVLMRLIPVKIALCLAFFQASAQAPKQSSPAREIARQLNQAFIEVVDQVSPSVVVIKVAHKPNYNQLDFDSDNPLWEMLPPEFRKQLERQREKQQEKEDEIPERKDPPSFDGQGSGIVIRKEGYILTNRHVVDGAEKIRVKFSDFSEFDAEVRGVDAQSDLAVLKIEATSKDLKPLRFADSDKTRVGEFAIAIGAPFHLDNSVTYGHVSAKGRSRIINDPSMDQDFIQTDANINPGNSGGPLVNIEGEIIGINTLIKGLRTGIGFAIPSNLAREVSEKLISDGRYIRAWLGVGIQALREDADYRDLITGISDGVVVTAILTNGPAAKSDLKPSDVITSVDGRPVATAQQLKNEIRSKKIGESVTLDVVRNGKRMKIKVSPDAWPEETGTLLAASRPSQKEETDKASGFGLTVEPVTRELAARYEISEAASSAGVIVTQVARGSAAERKQIRPGDLITEVNHKPVSSPKQFREALKGADPKKGVILNFTSRGTSRFEILKESGD